MIRLSKYLPVLIFFLLSAMYSCRPTSPENDQSSAHELEMLGVNGLDTMDMVDFDLDQIKRRGYLTAIVDNSSTGLFLYRGEPMGYEYELLSRYAETLGVELKFDITVSLKKAFIKLNTGQGDILAYNLTITKERRKYMKFTLPHNLVKQVLVQRKPKNWRDMKLHKIEKQLIRNPIDLIGKEVYVRKNSSYATRLYNLSDEIGGDIVIVEDFRELETEGIIQLLVDSVIDYTVVDEDIALVNARYHPVLDVKTAVSFPQQIAWGLRSNAPQLKESLDAWIVEMKKTNDYYAIYDKYFRSTAKSKKRRKSDLFSQTGENISPYDSLIKIGADSLGWNWQLLAAQISKESKFDPKAKSWVGACGLMQLMPRTGKEYGIRNLYDPAQNIRVGVLHLQWLQKKWQHITDSVERIKFVLASYNVGDGHVRDAVKLAKKYGAEPEIWEGNVARYLELKSQKKYYNDPVVTFGYCRGNEPVVYVKEILYRYNRYQQMTKTGLDRSVDIVKS